METTPFDAVNQAPTPPPIHHYSLNNELAPATEEQFGHLRFDDGELIKQIAAHKPGDPTIMPREGREAKDYAIFAIFSGNSAEARYNGTVADEAVSELIDGLGRIRADNENKNNALGLSRAYRPIYDRLQQRRVPKNWKITPEGEIGPDGEETIGMGDFVAGLFDTKFINTEAKSLHPRRGIVQGVLKVRYAREASRLKEVADRTQAPQRLRRPTPPPEPPAPQPEPEPEPAAPVLVPIPVRDKSGEPIIEESEKPKGITTLTFIAPGFGNRPPAQNELNPDDDDEENSA